MMKPSPALAVALVAAAALAVALVARPVAAVTITPNKPSVSIPLEPSVIEWMGQFVAPGTPAPEKYAWPFNSPSFLPWTDDRIRKTVPGCAPEQVHLGYWSEPSHVAEAQGRLSVLVSWTTCDSRFGTDVPQVPLPLDNAKSEVWTRPRGSHGRYVRRFTGTPTSYVTQFEDAGKTPRVTYTSPIVHHVLIKHLKPGERVDFAIPNLPQVAVGRRRLAQSDNATASAAAAAGASAKAPQFPAGTFYGAFTAPKAKFPFKITVAGDVAQMDPNVTVVLQNLVKLNPDLNILLGDNAYHDDTGTKKNAAGQVVDEYANFARPEDLSSSALTGFYSPRWESWHRRESRLLFCCRAALGGSLSRQPRHGLTKDLLPPFPPPPAPPPKKKQNKKTRHPQSSRGCWLGCRP
jgi:hypothetical protein